MFRSFFEPVLQIAVVIPFILLGLNERSKANFRRVFFFILSYIVYQLALGLPKILPLFDFSKSSWNWDGKLYGIAWAVLAGFLFKNEFAANDFLTLKQNRKGWGGALAGSVFVVVLSTLVWYLFGNADLDYETLFFQATLPGVDEEILFRGVLLGLLLSSLKRRISIFGSPAVLITSVLFGLTHALTLDKNNSVQFELIYFLQTGFAGYIWAEITLRSKSVLLATASHNLSNFFGTLATMIK